MYGSTLPLSLKCKWRTVFFVTVKIYFIHSADLDYESITGSAVQSYELAVAEQQIIHPCHWKIYYGTITLRGGFLLSVIYFKCL